MFHMADGIMCFTATINACANVFLGKSRCSARRCLQPPQGELHPAGPNDGANALPVSERDVRLSRPCDRWCMAHLRCQTGARHGHEDVPNASLPRDGATEALGITILGPEYHTPDERGEKMMRSCGRPFRGVLLSIQSPDRRILPPGQVGEVCIRSNSVMKGYWNKPHLTEDVMHDNWYHSGDAGFLDEKGFLTLVDRVKDMLITGGENVYSAEVENALMLHPAIEECAIIGLPDESGGTRTCLVRLKPGGSVTGPDLQQHCRQHLAGYKSRNRSSSSSGRCPRRLGKMDKTQLKRAIVDRNR